MVAIKILNTLLIWSILIVTTIETVLDCKIIKTEDGYIRGRRALTLFDNKPFYEYMGIPFAKPPIKDLRFKPPHKAVPWSGIKDALEYGNDCAQIDMTGKYFGNEDCLFINVFVPIINNDTSMLPLPVMVFIYGGGYTSGASSIYGPDFLLNNDIIMVSFNYRVGPFGFLSLGTPEYSGNMGLKDQLAALQWVNRNIHNFGGDTNKITIFGESAGSASTHFQIIVPQSRGLFQRAILQSGSVLNTFAYYNKNDHLDILSDLVPQTENKTEDMENLVEYILNVDPAKFLNQTLQHTTDEDLYRREINIIWSPIVESVNAEQPFLIKKPEHYMLEIDVDNIDTLIGYTSAEAYFFMIREFSSPELLEPFNEKFKIQLPLGHLHYDYDSEEYKEIARDIRNYYFPDGAMVNNETFIELSKLLSDCWFIYGIDQSVKLQHNRSTGKTYYYKFSLDTELNMMKYISGATELSLPGSTHADDLMYIFKMNSFLIDSNHSKNFSYEELPLDSIEVRAIREVTKIWTNFAKYGDPTPDSYPIDFKPVNGNVINFLDFTNDGLLVGVDPFGDRIQFWDDLFRKYKDMFK